MREGSVPRRVGAVPELWVPPGREKELVAVGEKLDAPISVPIPWLCKRRMPGFACLSSSEDDFFIAMPSLATCSRRMRSKLDSPH